MKSEYDKALEIMSSNKPDVVKAYKFLLKAEKRDPRATYAIATWHLFGKAPVVKKNYKEAVRRLRIASKAFMPEAAFDLAICYEKGKGVSKSLPKAFEYYLIAALWGDKQACFEVARMYRYGLGVARSKRICDVWLDRAEYLGLDIKLANMSD